MEYQKVISSRKYLECKYDENGKEIVVNNWSRDVNSILDKIRINSILLSNEHKKSYFFLSAKLKWFRIPMILLSSIGSIFNVGLPTYIDSQSVEIICAIIALFVSLIGSLELFLAISTKMESELIQSKELYLLAIEIEKTLLLDSLHRNGDGIAYLEDRFNMYSKLIENSQLLECRIIDELTPLPDEYIKKIVPNINIFFQKNSKSRGTSSDGKSPRRFDIRSFHNQLFMKGGLFPKQNAIVPEDQIKQNVGRSQIGIQNGNCEEYSPYDSLQIHGDSRPDVTKQSSGRNRKCIYRSISVKNVVPIELRQDNTREGGRENDQQSRLARHAILEKNEQMLDNARMVMEQSSKENGMLDDNIFVNAHTIDASSSRSNKYQKQPRKKRRHVKNKTMRLGHRKIIFSDHKNNIKLKRIGSDDTSVALDLETIIPTNKRRTSLTFDSSSILSNAIRRSFQGNNESKLNLNKLGRRSLDRILINTNMKMADAAQLIPDATELLSQIRKLSNDATATNVKNTLSNYPENTPYNKMQNVIIHDDVYKKPLG